MNDVADRQRATFRTPSITDQGVAAGARATGCFRYLHVAQRGRKETHP